MGSRTISLENAAYLRLKAAKRPGESFSDAVRRILSRNEPSFSDFRGLLDRKAANELANAVARMRAEDAAGQKRGLRVRK